MKLLRYLKKGFTTEKLGIQLENSVLDTSKLGEHLNLNVPQTMNDFLNDSQTATEQLHTVQLKAKQLNLDSSQYTISLSDIHYLPPVKHPEKIISVGLNYVEHIKSIGGEVPTSPVFFGMFSNALAAHNQVIPLPAVAREVDYEAELVIIIGKEINSVCEKLAADAILGYSIGNDLTERTLQYQTSQWMIGKSMDYFAPIGPVLVTKDEIEDVQNLKITTRRNGSVVQLGSTKDMLFSVVQIVTEIAQYMTLKPGDVIFTGTPKGVISETDSDRDWLRPKDRIDATIEGIGTLSNTIA